MIYDALIIGGGASGLAAACDLVRGGASVILLEKQPRVGHKLLATGNGRCNMTNLNASASCFHGDREAAQSALSAFPPDRIRAFFEGLGVPSVADEAGRVYPMSNQAASVLDALRLYAAENGCEIVTDCAAEAILPGKMHFTVRAGGNRSFQARNVLVCTGGLAAPKLGACGDGYKMLESLGHSIVPRFPAIAALKTPPEIVRGLKGQRAGCTVSLLSCGKVLRQEDGEVIFADDGVSGIAVMQLARKVGELLRKKKPCELRLSFLTQCSPERALSILTQRARHDLPARPMEDFLNGIVSRRLGQVLVRASGIAPMSRPASTLSEDELRALAAILTGWTLPVIGVQGFEQAQVTAGGVSLKDFDPATLQSRKVPRLYAAGEVLDVDGDCGGFNLQWAWSSALIVSHHILQK